jgi:hypothetical protein
MTLYEKMKAYFRSGKSREEELRSIGEAVVERAFPEDSTRSIELE